jgi:DNA-binding protein HU-beta
MNKMELVEAAASKARVPKAVAKKVLDAALDEIRKSLSKKETVSVTGFGTFLVTKRAARTGRNPRTGASLKIPAMNVPRFRAGKALKQAVR